MNGISAIHSRIAAIEGRFRTPAPVATPPAQDPSSSTGTAPSTASRAAPVHDAFAPAFAAALDGGGTTPAARLAPGAYGPLSPPPELAAYGNGRVPAAALTPIGDGTHHLHAPAAQAFSRMEADARLAGIDLGIISSYRDLPTQQRLAAEKGLYSQGGLAATPGTSNHGWGLSVDLELDARALDWMRANGPRYGFVEDVPREPWHWTYRPA
ncbi:M15 family metallopeptidase [Actinomarinicola tropica]|uniref:Peptidase M15 n=1 Tax=Actinomarinicola tropica TaxID=2789776 RepID=A0A5Q2RHE3_9ACTN|nr:M15 family metallopeptidase [Actinomarinicola tropica]QGG93736.1 peptidase M15 [Actinomarinicola tropica]